MKKLLAILLLWTWSTPLLAQTPTTAQREQMKKLDWMVGQWKGESWIEFAPGQRRTNISTESVQSKVGGSVLLIEGLHKGKRPGKDEEVITHDALALLLYDEKAKRYRFLAYTAGQGYGEYEPKLIEGGWQWESQSPSGRVRFTIKRTDKGEWYEVGELSPDGQTWRQFFEMRLQRVK